MNPRFRRWAPAFYPEGLGRYVPAVFLAVAVFSLASTPLQAGAAERKEPREPKTSIPAIAKIAGIKVGYSSMADLEAQLGNGKVMIGGHPNGARLWRVKGTSWVIHADAFEYSIRGAVVDDLDIKEDRDPGADVPYTRLTPKDLAWLGTIRLGMSEASLVDALKQLPYRRRKVADGWLLQARGYSPKTSVPLYPYRAWSVKLSVENDRLCGIGLGAS